MANHMAEVAKMLGVELEERFNIIDSKYEYAHDYYLTDNGIAISNGNYCQSESLLHQLLCGTCIIKRKPWKPKDRDAYFYVDKNGDVYKNTCFEKDDFVSEHLNYYKIGNCYQTPEEAEANRDKWVAFYTSDEVLEV